MEDEIQLLSYRVVPRTNPIDEIHLSDNDILMVFVDNWNIEETQMLYKTLNNFFPNNDIVILPEGIDMRIIKNDENEK